jgi:hypothetical protein
MNGLKPVPLYVTLRDLEWARASARAVVMRVSARRAHESLSPNWESHFEMAQGRVTLMLVAPGRKRSRALAPGETPHQVYRVGR